MIFTGVTTRMRYFEPRHGLDKKGRNRYFPAMLILIIRGYDPRKKTPSAWQDTVIRGRLAEWGNAHLQLRTRVCIFGQLVRSTYTRATTGKRAMMNQVLVREILLYPFLSQDPTAEVKLSNEVGVEFETDPEADLTGSWVTEDDHPPGDNPEDTLEGPKTVDE